MSATTAAAEVVGEGGSARAAPHSGQKQLGHEQAPGLAVQPDPAEDQPPEEHQAGRGHQDRDQVGRDDRHARPHRLGAEEWESSPVLTNRQVEIVRVLAQGRTNAEINTELFIAPGTVKNHVAAIQRKLGVRNWVGIAAWAWDTGMVEPA